MDDVRGHFLGMPHGTTPAAVTTNKNIIMSSFKCQSTLDVKQNARTITLAFILLELFPFELCHKIVSALLIENISRYLFETSFEYKSTAYHVQSARMELCKYSMIIYFS